MIRKNYVYFIPLFLLLIFGVCLTGCFQETPFDENHTDEDNEYQGPLFYIENLNYNIDYNNPAAPDEKGFILYDKIDFNKVTIVGNYEAAPYFILKKNDTVITEIRKANMNASFPLYEALTPGNITVEVYIPVDNRIKKDEFTVHVAANGLPSGVEFLYTDAENNRLESLSGGKEIKITAVVYSGDDIITEDSEKFTSGWQSVFLGNTPLFSAPLGDNGEREIVVTLPNMPQDATLSCVYRYKPSFHTTYSLARESVSISNNLAAFEHDWGMGENEEEVSYLYKGLIANASARYVFNNGDFQNIDIALQNGAETAGKLVPFIRYDGEGEYQLYAGTKFDYSQTVNQVTDFTVTRYVQNGVNYYFKPDAAYAEIYLAHQYEEAYQGGSFTKYRKAEGTDYRLQFSKDAPETIHIASVSGKELKQNQSSPRETYPSFTRNVKDGKVFVMVYVANTMYTTASVDTQHFIPSVEVTGETPFKDYYFIYDWRKVQRNNKGQFFASEAGEVVIDVVSCHDSDVKFRLYVDVQNPVTERRLKENQNINLYHYFDPSPHIFVDVKYYNYSTITRKLSETEFVRYFYDNVSTPDVEVTGDHFVHRDTVYQGYYVIRLYENGVQVGANQLQINSYIAPDYYVEINGEIMRIADFSDTMKISDTYFISYTPYLEKEVADPANPSLRLLEKSGDTYSEVSSDKGQIFKSWDGIWYVTYRCFTVKDAPSQPYAKIGAIKFVPVQ